MPIVELRELLQVLGQHSQSAFLLLHELSEDKSVLLQAKDNLATIARLHAITEQCARRSRQVDKRVMQAILRGVQVSRIVHYALNRIVRRQLSMRVMEAYRRRGELLLDAALDYEECALHRHWSTYLAAERWLVSTGATMFPTNPVEALRLIELWMINGRPGPQ